MGQLQGVETSLVSRLSLCLLDMEEWGNFWLSASDWKKIESVAGILHKVKIVGKAFEAEATPTSNLVIYHVFNLKNYLQDTSRSPTIDRSVKYFKDKLSSA